jgi:hypothetical protein
VNQRSATWNTASYWGLIILCGAAVVFVIVQLVIRLAQVLPNSGVPVTVPLEETASLPVGPGGRAETVAVTQGIVHVSGMPGITLVSLVLAAVVTAATVIALVAFLGIFCINMSRGRVFVRGNVRLVLWAGGTLLVGWALSTLFTTMGVNGAFAALSDHSYDNVRFGTDYTPLFAAIAVLLVGTAFEAGLRLQRDTEGLV